MDKHKKDKSTSSQQAYPPVIAVLGHVDHGKTTLLDAIRKTSIAAREVGGITQKIGASSVELIHEGKKRKITFIDTPGHEAFSQMRGRGAKVADLALLVVAATEGLKPQTKESIDILKKTNTRFIVVLTKSDLPTKNVDRVKQELLAQQITLEEYGGEVPSIEVSAKTNSNIKELLDLILLAFDLNKTTNSESEISANAAALHAIVIESKLDPKSGSRATIVIKNGTIKVRDHVHTDGIDGKIRSIINDRGQSIKEASIGEAVEILGLEKVPGVGNIITHKDKPSVKQVSLAPRLASLKREMVYRKNEKEEVNISVILVCDTQGSLEAIINTLPGQVKVIVQKTGEVSEADVLHAKSTGSIVLSFNTKLRPEIIRLAMTEKILLRNYTIIYEMLDEVKDALEGKLQAQMEQIFGRAKVLAKFPFEKTFAFGIQVIEGRVARSDRIRVMRNDAPLAETSIASLRVAKNPVSKVEKGHEAGILITSAIDIQVGDVILSHS
jgi:translation initiation factor IF-2